VYFRGNDRSPGDRAVDVGKSAAEILGEVLPEVFDRFKGAAARPSDVKKGVACRHRRDCCPRKGGVLMAGVYSSRICSQAANASENTRSSEVPFSIAIMAR
jgi:hypothetical protein